MTAKHRSLFGLTILMLVVCALPAQQQTPTGGPIVLGKLTTGATVSFSAMKSGEWGIDIAGPGTPHVSQQRPARLEIFTKEAVETYSKDDIRQLAGGYRSLETTAGGVIAHAEIAYGPDVTFHIEDRWRVNGPVLSVQRTVEVAGNASGGFYSAVLLSTEPPVTWTDIDYLAPALLYGDIARNGDRTPGGKFNYAARHYGMREDWMPAPLFALSFEDGNSIAVLNPSPRGDTTAAESHSDPGTVMIDERYQFGALGASEAASGGVEFGYWLPGSAPDYASVRSQGYAPRTGPPDPAWRRRYHPIKQGLTQRYEVAFRFARDGRFSDATRNTWRWAWQTLKPAVAPMDVELIRRTLLDHLADRVMTINGNTGIPYLVDTRTGKIQDRMDASRAAMGFCAKNIEAADQLLREADRDPGPRGQRMRALALAIIDTFIRLIPMSPPAGDGFDLFTGKLAPAVWSVGQQFIRPPAEDLLVLVNAYRRERSLGREHPEWLRWSKEFADWLIAQQRPDGSFPRSWKPGTSEVVNPDGSASYVVPPLLVAMHGETGEQRYLDAAVRAGEYLWATDGTRGLFHGGSIDASSIEVVTDGEGGHLSMLAFLSLYEATERPEWLERAKVAADYTESWVWIWNVPMPADENDEALHWKKGVPTVGVSGITVRSAGHIHVHLSWAAPMYAQLYEYTKDEHYLEVARVLVHALNPMLALPGRTYGMLGPGWVQENWRVGPGNPGRGFGTPGKWLPWLATVRLHAITAIEERNPRLFGAIFRN